MIRVRSKGDLSKTRHFLNFCKNQDFTKLLQAYGEAGVEALREATPKDTGETADSWYYTIAVNKKRGVSSVTWANSKIVDNVPIAIILQYGHATGGGGYVEGIDYINPALKDLFQKMAADAWSEVRRA